MIAMFAAGFGTPRVMSPGNIQARLAQLIADAAAHPPRRAPAAPPPRSLSARLLRMDVIAHQHRDALRAAHHAQMEDLWARNYGVRP